MVFSFFHKSNYIHDKTVRVVEASGGSILQPQFSFAGWPLYMFVILLPPSLHLDHVTMIDQKPWRTVFHTESASDDAHYLSKPCRCVAPLLPALKIKFRKMTTKFFKPSEAPLPPPLPRVTASIPDAPLISWFKRTLQFLLILGRNFQLQCSSLNMYFSNDWIYDACEGILRIQRSEIGMKGSWDVRHLAINRHVPDSLRSLNRNSSVDDENEKLVLMVPSREKNC